ncbi:hypothetical protein ACIBG8_29005 [Nonomuraea sp. NPDC050556]|uniref:hypothetical protein n=1 Tax=Nonomuraea sp. NPDC050556 TaxID=3364369 RepID=UPI0037A285D8
MLIALTILSLAGCQGSEANVQESSRPASGAPTKGAPPPDQAPIVSYRDLYPAGQSAERAEPRQRKEILGQYATDPLLSRMSRGIAALRVTGRVTWGLPVIHPYDLQIEGDTATLHDCQDARKTGQADDKTSERLTHGTANTHLRATLRKGADGAWRVATLEQLEEPCVVSS